MRKKDEGLDGIALNMSLGRTDVPVIDVGRFMTIMGDSQDSWAYEKEEAEEEPSYSEELIAQYQFFNRWIYSPRRVFYPCSRFDASPIRGFPDAEVVLMDCDERVSKIMEEHKVPGYVHGDVISYVPEKPFDLVLMLNPAQNSKGLAQHLVKGGYVLANNWHDNASQLSEDPDYQTIGTIDVDGKGIFLARNLDKLEPEQFEVYLYVFRNRGVEAA